jgi:carboxyl-terminal processing protease
MNRKLRIGVVTVSLAAILFIVAGGLGVHASSNDGAYRQLGVFSEVLNRIRTEYVEEPDFNVVREGALHGLLESLDANSSYLSPAEYKKFRERKPDGRASIGATISKRFGLAAVVAVVPGGPADKVGLENGDILESIDGQTTRNMSVAEIREALNGQKGSNVTVIVLRPRRAEPEKVTLTRDDVALPAVQERMLEANIGYVRPGSLVKGKAQEIASKLKQIQNSGAKKIVLDLRNTAEGEFTEAIAAANLFLDHGNITSLKGQTYPREDFNADPAKAITKVPLVTLVNRATAGPAELLAVALLENRRADAVGDKTFGIGSVQKLIEVPDGSAIILSIAKYYSPSGKAIQDNAVTPNILVADADDFEIAEAAEDDATADETAKDQQQAAADEQLKRAIAVLKNKTS